MSAKMKRRGRQARRKRILAHRRENALFFAHGTIPASSRAFAMCSCGAAAFSRGDDPRFHEDFRDAHAYCGEDYS